MNRNYFGTLLVLFVFVFTLNAYGQSTNELVMKFNDLMQNGNYEEGISVADRIIERLPNQPLGYNNKGRALSALNKKVEAIEYFKKALPFAKKDKYAYLGNIANAYTSLNSFDDAIEYYNRALNENNRLFAYQKLRIANIYLLKGDKGKALSTFDEAKGGIEAAEKALRETSENNKGNAYGIAALVAYQLSKDDETIEYAKKYNDLKDTDNTKVEFATYLARLGHKEKAKDTFNSANTSKCAAISLSRYYLFIDDNANANRYFDSSFAEQKTPAQLETWRLSFKQDVMYPRPDWAKARNQEWFKNKVSNNL